MPTQSVSGYTDTCQKLARAINDLSVRIRVSEQNVKLRESYLQKSETLQRSVEIINRVTNVMKPMLEDTMNYATERRKESMQNINNALRLAGEIIQDSTEGIHFKLDGDEAWLSTPDDLEVDDVEGGGYRQISSTFLRSVVLAANDKTLNCMLLDEIFSLVSPETSAALSLYLNVMCQNMQVISIEQKPQVYSNIDCLQYKFVAGDDFTNVYKSTVSRGGLDNESEVEGAV